VCSSSLSSSASPTDSRTAAAEFGDKYLDLLLASWYELARALRRTTTYMVLLTVTFVLLSGAQQTEFTLGPLKLTNVESVLPVVPALLSFFLYEWVVLVSATDRYKKVADTLLKKMHPTIVANDLELMLRPPVAMMWGGEAWSAVRSEPAGLAGRLLSSAALGIGAVLLFGGLAFHVFAFVDLYGNDGRNTLAVTISLVFCVFNLARAFLVIYDTTAE
jgi:hypothetical protein